jgi:hypothetical protein
MEQRSSVPATQRRRPSKATAGQTTGHLAASFAMSLLALAQTLGLPITVEQQNALFQVISIGWAFGSALYAIRHHQQSRQ